MSADQRCIEVPTKAYPTRRVGEGRDRFPRCAPVSAAGRPLASDNKEDSLWSRATPMQAARGMAACTLAACQQPVCVAGRCVSPHGAVPSTENVRPPSRSGMGHAPGNRRSPALRVLQNAHAGVRAGVGPGSNLTPQLAKGPYPGAMAGDEAHGGIPLRRLREPAGMTIAAVAARAGVEASRLAEVEGGIGLADVSYEELR